MHMAAYTCWDIILPTFRGFGRAKLRGFHDMGFRGKFRGNLG